VADSDGAVLETETSVDFNELPAAVRAAEAQYFDNTVGLTALKRTRSVRYPTRSSAPGTESPPRQRSTRRASSSKHRRSRGTESRQDQERAANHGGEGSATPPRTHEAGAILEAASRRPRDRRAEATWWGCGRPPPTKAPEETVRAEVLRRTVVEFPATTSRPGPAAPNPRRFDTGSSVMLHSQSMGVATDLRPLRPRIDAIRR
jgi:hypothetical protein